MKTIAALLLPPSRMHLSRHPIRSSPIEGSILGFSPKKGCWRNRSSRRKRRLRSAINVTTALSNAGVAATSNASYGVIYLTAPAQFGISSVTVGATGSPSPTETITTSVTANLYFAGTPTTGDKVNVTVLNSAFTGGTHNVQYTVLSSDTSATILASSVASAINSDSTLSAQHISATANSGIVTITAPSSAGTVSVISNTNGTVAETITYSGHAGDTFSITAYDAALPGGQKTERYSAKSSDTALRSGCLSHKDISLFCKSRSLKVFTWKL